MAESKTEGFSVGYNFRPERVIEKILNLSFKNMKKATATEPFPDIKTPSPPQVIDPLKRLIDEEEKTNKRK